MKIKENLIGLSPYKPGKPISEVKEEFGLNKVVKLASNENPFGCSSKVKDEIVKVINDIAIYPDGYAAKLRETVAHHVGVDREQLIFGNGSDEIIQIVCRALLEKGTNTVCAVPSFPQYKHNAIIEGAQVREIPLINGVHDLDRMLDAIDDDTRVVWICNPNNPSGTYVSEEAFFNFMERVPANVLVVSDEAYYEYVVAHDYPQTINLLEKFNNLLITRTFSKAYGLAGLRVGYGIGNVDFIKKIEPAREPFNTSTVAQAAAAAAIDDQEFIKKCIKLNRQGLEQFYQFCEANCLSYYPAQGNFILIDMNTSGDKVFQYLLERGFIIRSGVALGFPTAIRVTVGNTNQNSAIIEQLQEFLRING